jgi:hypothetical protein
MTRFGLLFALLFCLNTNPSWAKYTLPDLEVLTQEGNYDEFFAHALDIRPSERQDAWKGMLSKMADGYGRQILARTDITKALYNKSESLFAWPAMRADDVFKLHRQEIGLRYLKVCLKQSEPCWKELKAFWEADKSDPEVAFKLAQMTVSYPEKPMTSWTFLEIALKSPLSEFYCKNDFVLEAVWGKLEIDYIRLGTKGDFLKKIDESIHPDCLISLNQWTLKKLNKPDKSSDRELAYQILHAQGKTNPAVTDFFYTVYLLENPSQGELFNYAWNRLTELSKSIDRREEVLKRMKTLDPLPDELFSSLDEIKKRAVLTHFKTKFPEYLYYYADQCILFYGGKTAFPQGNPTIKCQNFMEAEEARALLGKDKIERFYKVRNL